MHIFIINQVLCGAAWINSKAKGKGTMLIGSPADKIALKDCTTTIIFTTKPLPLERAAAVVLSSTTVRACPQCGIIDSKHGIHSCCAQGGTWFRRCGHDQNFDHTWAEGVEVCKGEITAPTITSPPINRSINSRSMIAKTCSKCGINEKSDKRSCCAPGGAWFKNCGSARNRTIDHTWVEGVEACRGNFGQGGSS